MSGIGGRAPRHLPVLANGQPTDRVHRHEHLLPPMINARTRRQPEPVRRVRSFAEVYREVTGRDRRTDRRAEAITRRNEQKEARVAAGVDRSSPDAGPRPRWSR